MNNYVMKFLKMELKYMDNVKNDEYYIEKIIKDLKFIVEHTSDLSSDDLYSDEVLLDSMLFRLIQISENAKKLTDEYKDSHSQVPWKDIYGLRNKIVHNYGDVDLEIVYDTLEDDVPDLLKCLEDD